MTFLDAEILKAEEEYSIRARRTARKSFSPRRDIGLDSYSELGMPSQESPGHPESHDELSYFMSNNRAKPVLTKEQEYELTTKILGLKQKVFSYLIAKPEVRSQVYAQIEKSLMAGKGRKPKKPLANQVKGMPGQGKKIGRRTVYSNINDLISKEQSSPILFGKRYERLREHKANYALSRLITNADYTPGFQQYIITEAEKALPILFKKDKKLARNMSELAYYREEMFRHNIKLLIYMANKNLFRAKKMGFQDIYQEGSMGLMKAIDRYDPRKGFRFSTYATNWIKQTITRSVSDKDSAIRMPVHLVEKIYRHKKYQDEQARMLGRKPTEKELARALKITRYELQHIKGVINPHPVSLSTPIGQAADTTLGDLLPGQEYECPELSLSAKALFSKAMDVLEKKLSDRELTVIKKRFGLEEGNYGIEKTLQEVGDDLGVTRERIRQIEGKALRKAQSSLALKGLKNSLPQEE